MTELIGQALGSYQIDALLGDGPAGPRYAARHTRLQRPAALRLFDAGLAARPDDRRRLLVDLRQASGLKHPQIVEIFDVGEQDGRLFVASELLAGGTLRALLQRRRREKARLPLAAALGIARQAAEGVAFAHARGIIHGALSPEALRLVAPPEGDAAPALKVDDFGIAAVFPQEATAAPAYLTPEQCRGLPLDARGDVYALGVLLYELTVGAPPFNVASVEQAVEKHTRTRPVPPRMVRPELPAALEAVVLRCLAKAPDDRFADAGALAEALRELEAALPGRPPALAPAPPPAQPPAPAQAALAPLPPLDDDDLLPADPLLAGLLGDTAPAPRPAPPQGAPTQRVAPPPPPPPPPPAAQIAVAVDYEHVQIAPGRPNFVSVRLSNLGDATDTFSLAVDGVPGAWLRDIDLPMRLAPGQSAVVPIVVEVPAGARGEAGDYPALVRARSVSDPAIAASARMIWSVLPYAAASISISPEWAEGAVEADYTITLRNEGNGPATYLLSADDRGRVLGYELGEEQLSLAPGQTARVPLIVEAPRKLIGAPDEITFAVFAEPDSGEPILAEAAFTRRPALPTWLAGLLGAMLLALAVLAFLLGRPAAGEVAQGTPVPPTAIPTPQPGAPQVAAFTVSPSVVAPGQPVTLFWDVRGAERVTIDQLGDVPPFDQREYRPEQTTDFRLVAVAGGKETISIQRVLVAAPTATPEPAATPAPSATAAPTAEPTAVPTAAPPPTLIPVATAAPPTAEPSAVPPTAPPTAVPTAAPPTAVPTAAPPAAPTPISLFDRAPGALWSTDAALVRFGRPAQAPEAGGWGEQARDVALEDGSTAAAALFTLPPLAAAQQGAAPFVEARYAIPQLPAGQQFLADVGFAQGAAGPGATALVTFNGEVLFEGQLLPDGQLTPISADMGRFAGAAGQLILRVTAAAGPSPDGVYWVRPRIDLPPQ